MFTTPVIDDPIASEFIHLTRWSWNLYLLRRLEKGIDMETIWFLKTKGNVEMNVSNSYAYQWCGNCDGLTQWGQNKWTTFQIQHNAFPYNSFFICLLSFNLSEIGSLRSNWPNSRIYQCTSPIPNNAPFRTEMCTFLFWMGHWGI